MSRNHEKIITTVQKYPILYDTSHPEYKNQFAKNKQWERIGETMNMSGEEVKSKWKNLRDTYSKYLRSFKPVDNASKNRYGRWQWASAMEFLREHITSATDTTVYVNEAEKEAEIEAENEAEKVAVKEAECTTDHNYTFRPSPVPSSPKKKKSHHVEKVIWSLNERANKLSSTEHIMLGYAKVIDEFSVQRRIETKMKIAQIIMEAELEEEEERIRHQNPGFQSLAADPLLTESEPVIGTPLISRKTYSKKKITN